MTMADIRCLICNRVNDSSAERCWYCHTTLPKPTGPLTQQEREKLASQKAKSHPPKPETPLEPGQKPSENQPEEEIPEWLARIRQLKQEEDLTRKTSQPDRSDEPVPEWLKNLQETAAEESPIDLEARQDGKTGGEKPALDESLDFLDQLPNEILPEFDDVEGERKSFGKSPELTTSSPGDEARYAMSQPEGGEESPTRQVLPPMNEEEIVPLNVYENLSDELQGAVQEEPAQEEPIPPDLPKTDFPFPLLIDDLPDWLSTEQPLAEQAVEPKSDEEPNQSIPVEKKLEKGKLPAWLQAIRPPESISPISPVEQPQSPPQEQGVLAGIAGTLQGADLSERILKPKSYTQELHVSPAQQQNVELFKRLLQPEIHQPADAVLQPIAARGNTLLRVLVTLLILLAVILPFFSTSFSGITPVLYSSEVVDSLNLIQELPIDKPVLVAAHFEAGLAGELSWTAQPVLEHLVSRGIPMALTSTNVIGFAILEDQVRQAAGESAGYVLEDKVVDLGYLPGGTIGLTSLVSDPLAALPFTTDLKPSWKQSLTENVDSFSDFGALILLTDSPEIARTWVEQIGRADSPPPMIAVISAQAAPLLQPYYDSGQINGYITGLNGAVSYELLRSAPGQASFTFGSYQVASLLVALIIFVGGAASLILSSVSVPKKKGED